jgi:glutamate---cysteine ligase / carboxylate-amine ligase
MRIAFNQSERSTLGVEMELMIADRATGELASAGSQLLAEMGRGHPGGEHPKAKHELLECTVEVITGICDTVAEARTDLAATIAELAAVADRSDLVLLSAGTHPLSSWHDQTISPAPRYAALVRDMQWPAQRLQIFGMHVHVGIRSGEKAIAIANALTRYLPIFLALSASSPYWEAHDTGLASARSKVFEALPTAGLPPQLDDWADFERFMHTLVHAEAISTIREVWWDIRPHPDFGTVELRICDAVPTLQETTALAALAQCLVTWFDGRLDAGEELTFPRDWVMRQNKWLAARYGIDADLIVDENGTRTSTRELVATLVRELEPVAVELDCVAELAGIARILETGPSYRRQRAVVERGGSLVDVVEHLVAEFATDTPEKA